tara:strand:+ start:149 stop:916 length:768 start_codon:yes stop_codon:yes gene_type:complete
MNILEKIVIQKKNHYKYLEQKIKKTKLKKKVKPIFFQRIKNELKKNKNALIVEFKRCSPSVNNFKKIRTLQEVIKEYDKSQCCCISILTDRNFGGSLNDILIAKKITSKPIIRKDFIINKSQIIESKIYGADAILLIAKILTKNELSNLFNFATKIGLDVLIEIENKLEIKKLNNIKFKLIGINNRNLREQKIDINKSLELSELLLDKVVVSESGINNKNIKKIKSKTQISTFLIGGSILNNRDKIGYIDKLYQA